MEPDRPTTARRARRSTTHATAQSGRRAPDADRSRREAPAAIASLAQAEPFSLLDLTPDATVVVDAEWRIVAENAAARSSPFRAATGTTDTTLWHAWPLLKGDEPGETLRRSMADRAAAALTIQRRDERRQEIWLRILATPYADGLAVGVRDVTAEKEIERAARHSEERLKRALDATGALVYELDLGADRVAFAGNSLPLTGYRSDELPSTERWWRALINPDDLARIAAEMKATLDRGDDRFVTEYRLRHRDGSERDVWDHGIVLRDDEGRRVGTIGTIVDITERKRREVRAGLLQRLTAALSAALDPGTAAAVIIERAMPALGANAGNVYLLDDEAQELVSLAAAGYAAQTLEAARRLPLQGEAMMAEVARTGTPILVPTWEERLRRYPHHRVVHAVGGGRAVAGLPLKVEGQTIGALSLAFPTDRDFDDDERRFMATVADLCAQALQRARLYEALRQSESQARLVTDRAPTYLAHFDREGRYLYANRAYAARFGLTPDEVVGRFMPEVVGQAAYAALRGHIETALRGQDVEFEAEVPYRLLGTRFMQIAYAPDHDERGAVRGVIAVGLDATDRRQAELGRRFLSELSAVLTSSMNGVETLRRVARLIVPTLADYCFFDLVLPDGQPRRVAWAHVDADEQRVFDEQLAQYDAERYHPWHPISLAISTGEAQFVPVAGEAWQERIALSEEHLAFLRGRRLRSQITVPLRARGRILGALTLCRVAASGRRYAPEDLDLARDLADRTALAVDNARLYSEALEAEAKVRRLLDAGVIGVLVSGSDQILEANDHFLEMVGYPRDVLEQGHLRWRDLTPAEYEHLDDLAADELRAGGVFTPFEKELIRRDRSRLPILIGGAVLQAEPLVWIAFILDLTEQKRGENDWRAFIDATAHDLRNPLTAVLGQTQLLQRRLQRDGALAPDDLEERLRAVAAAAGRAAGLIDDLIDTARLRASQPLEMHATPIDLLALARACVAEAGRVGRSHAVRLETDEATLSVNADGRRIERVVRNMLDNAVKYSPDGGAVIARLRRESDAAGEWAVLEIEDQGLGIPAADLTRIFERFGRGTNVAGQIEGSGIGLTGAQQIAEQHGGAITVASVVGEGSTFTLRLPLRRPAAAHPR